MTIAAQRQSLTPDSIRDTALRLIDADGLDAFSMRRLAAELGVRAPSLYGHVPNKEALLDAIANHLARRVDVSGFEKGWQEGLLRWGRSYRSLLEEHPGAAPIIAAGTGRRAEYLAMADAVHGGLVRSGWPPRRATMIAAAVKFLVVGAASTPFASGFAADSSVYADRYSNLRDAHRLASAADAIDSASFEFALTTFVAGLSADHTHDTGRR